ncbi:hypothetical protein RJT34_01382 [Clitoria ternatea]|uniref:Uncharacterized protein n=1 Tax=Clitoria ternatea TaxID=43366 RepID=A0AAN9KK92_CLITE
MEGDEISFKTETYIQKGKFEKLMAARYSEIADPFETQGLTILCDGVPDKSDGNRNQGLSLLKPEFASDFDFDGYGKSEARILEANFRMSLAEFLVESKIVPVHAYGDLENKITRIHHDSRILWSLDGYGGALAAKDAASTAILIDDRFACS